MDPVSASILVGGTAGASAATYFGGKATNESNLQATRETNAYNERMWHAANAREDQAIQLRTNDLRKAGLSPTLAAGSAASTPSPIKMEAPREDNYAGPAIGNAIQSGLAMSQIAKTDSDIKRTGWEIGNIKANTSKTQTDEQAVNQGMEQELVMNNFKGKAISASTFRDQMEGIRKKYELERDKRLGLGDKSTPISRQTQDIVEAARLAGEKPMGPPQKPYDKSKNIWENTKFFNHGIR